MLQTILTTFYICWLLAVLVFLYLIWRRGAEHTMQLEQTLIKAAVQSAKAAEDASQAACLLACQLKATEAKTVEGRLP